MSNVNNNAIIIGAGLAGIATSIRLAVKGYEVDVYESSEGPGGKLNNLEVGEFRFDLGPSLFTMPHLVEELFSISGKDPAKYFHYKRLEMACRYFWGDGMVIDAWSEKNRLSEEIRTKLGINSSSVNDYLNHAERLFKKTSPIFLEASLHKPWKYKFKDIISASLYLPKMNIFSSMNKVNKRKLTHPKLVQLFNRMATYNGSDPYHAPGILTMISSLEHGSGAFIPEGGMFSITKSLVKLATELGVKFHYNTKVDKILTENNKVTGVEVSGNKHFSNIVVSNMDVVLTYKKLLPAYKTPEFITRQERSSSALVFYWGIDRSFPELDLHNIFFSNNYKVEFEYLFKHLDIYDDPTIYVNISSKENPADAPKGHENWFVMVNAPHLNGQDWAKIIQRTKENVISKLSSILKTDISQHIKAEYILDPAGIESKTSSYLGSLYGASSNSKFAAFLRHPNFSRKIQGLYFAGGSVHPGGGIPLVLLSAKIVDGLIKPVEKKN
jgi:diapolycopene oxygenase